MMWSPNAFFLAAFLFRITSARVQDQATDLCESDVFKSGFNASGSHTVPGFRVNSSYPETNWTWTRYVSNEYNELANKTQLWQTFGLETSPMQDLNNASLPYTGCIIVPDALMVAGREDDGTCHSVLSGSCVSEIIQKVNESAASISGTQFGSSSSFSCPQLMDAILQSSSSSCKYQWSGYISAEFLPQNFTGMTNPTACDLINPGNSNASSNAFFGWGKPSTDPENYTYYDQAIRTPHPLIVAVWLKPTTQITTEEEEQRIRGELGWADTKLLCVSAHDTTPGSRNLTVANRAAGAGSTLKVTKELFALVALAVLGLAL